MKKKHSVILAVLLLLFSSMVVQAKELSGKITIWGWNITIPPLQEAADRFMKMHPKTKINIVSTGSVDVNQKVSAGLMAKGRGLPDISLIQDQYFNGYVSLYPKQFVNLSKMGFDKHKSNFAKYKLDAVTYKGSIYGFPLDSGPVVMFYNRSAFKKAGIDPQSIKTWDDYLKAGIKIKKATGKYMFGVSDEDGTYFNIMAQYGVGYFDKKGNIDFLNPKSVAAMKLVKKMYDAGIVHKRSPGWDAWMRDISSGTIVAPYEGVWFGGSIAATAPKMKNDWGVIKLPANEDQVRASNHGGSSYLMFNSSKNKQLAYQFMEYYTTDTQNQVAAFKAGLFPTLNSVYKTKEFNVGVDYFAGQKIWNLTSETVDDIINLNTTSDFSYAQQESVKALQNVLFNGVSVEKALSSAASSLANRTGREINKY